MGFGKVVGILPAGERDDAHRDALAQQHVGTPLGSFNTRRVAVVEQRDLLGEAGDASYLLPGERCARAGHHIGETALVERDDIEVALDEVALVQLDDLAFGLREPEEGLALVVDLALG